MDVPNGKLTKERFIELSGGALGEDADTVAETIFKVFLFIYFYLVFFRTQGTDSELKERGFDTG